jgi:hypothetical protein
MDTSSRFDVGFVSERQSAVILNRRALLGRNGMELIDLGCGADWMPSTNWRTIPQSSTRRPESIRRKVRGASTERPIVQLWL